MVEFDLRIPVANWLISRGLSPVLECYSMSNCEIVGVRFDGKKLDHMVAVELKMDRVSEVIAQCYNHLERANETWAAMLPISQKSADKFVGSGCGLLEITAGQCNVRIPAQDNRDRVLTRWQNAMWRRRNEYIWRMKHPQMLKFPARRIVREEAQASIDKMEGRL